MSDLHEDLRALVERWSGRSAFMVRPHRMPGPAEARIAEHVATCARELGALLAKHETKMPPPPTGECTCHGVGPGCRWCQ